MAGITVPIDGDLSPILKTFGELPGRTQAEMAAVGAVIDREARRGSIAKGFAEIEGVSAASAKRAANAVIREMERASRDSEKALGDLKKGATVVFGGVVGDIEDVAGALMALGPASALVGGAIAGAAIVAGSAWAESQVLQYLYDAASATGALTDEQAALKKAFEDINLTVGTRVAPIFEGLLVGAVGATLAFGDFVSWLIRTRDAAIDFYDNMNPILKFLGAPILLPLEAGSRLDQIAEEMKSGAVEADSYIGRARALIGTIGETEKASEKAAEATKKHTIAHKAAADAAKEQEKAEFDGAAAWIKQQEALNRQEEQRVKNIQEAEQAGRDAYEAALAQERERAAAEKERAAARLEQIAAEKAAQSDYWNSTATAGISAAATLAQAVSDGAAEGSKAQKDAAMVAFRINQAQSLASIGMNTAEAASKAVALFGPPPSPLGIAGIVAATAIGLTQAAAVAAQPPPSFHTGGVIASQPLAPDETMIRARKGEEIRTRQEQGGGAGVTVQMVYQHRIFDTFVADNLKQTGSPLRREIGSSSGRLLGHRERAR